MKKVLYLGLIILSAVLGWFWAGRYQPIKSKQRVEKPIIKIGVVLPLTGNQANWGEGAKNGILLAAENIPDNTRYKYEFIIENNSGEVKNTAVVATKLLNQDKIKGIISQFDPAGNVIGPLAAEKKVIHIGTSWFPQYVKLPYNFSLYSSIKEESALLAAKIQKEKLNTAALFTVNHSGFNNGTELLKTALKEKNIRLCEEVKFNFGQRDFKPEILKTDACKPDIFIIGSFPPEADIITRQLKEKYGDDVKITGLDLGLDVFDWDLYENYWFAAPKLPKQSFINQYLERFNNDNYLFGAGVAYDRAMLLVDAFENSPRSEDAAAYLENLKRFDGVSGNIIRGEKGIFYSPAGLYMIKDKKFVVAGINGIRG